MAPFLGTSLHGLFEDGRLRRAFINYLGGRISPLTGAYPGGGQLRQEAYDLLAEELRRSLNIPAILDLVEKERPQVKLAATLMIQGTSSHVGKSVLVTGLCRVFARRGSESCPLQRAKHGSQQLHHRRWGELGGAQAIQAEAAMTEPLVEMNPILLKPVDGHHRGSDRHGEVPRQTCGEGVPRV